MKLNKTFWTLIAAIAFLPALACADTEKMTAISDSGVAHCEYATTLSVIANDMADPMEKAVNALVRSTDDPVLASYYRDLYRADTVQATVQFVRVPDPYTDAIVHALYGSAYVEPRAFC